MNQDTEALIKQADIVFKQYFPATTWFERAIFFSWWCGIRDCQFCYMSSQKNSNKEYSIRHEASILAEVWLCKKLGWEIGFFTGGINAFSTDKVLDMLQKINVIYGKVWLSVGPLSKPLLEKYKPYIKGIVGSTETINPILHKKVCPSKPLEPYYKMFETAHELGLETAMTFIVGLGETKEDFPLLADVIKKYYISKIHVYGLIPHEGTVFAHAQAPTAEEQVWWIAQIRIAFPTIDIQCGIWSDRIERTHILLKAGANSISKYQAIKLFAKQPSVNIETEAEKAGRIFTGTLTKLPELNINEIDAY
ncbi:MAG: radical SAM protein, partial [Candidatus Woesearchaeota archaeon]